MGKNPSTIKVIESDLKRVTVTPPETSEAGSQTSIIKISVADDSDPSRESHQLSLAFFELGARVVRLQRKASRLRVAELEKRVSACEADYQRLYEQAASLTKADIAQHYSAFVDIQERLIDIREVIKSRVKIVLPAISDDTEPSGTEVSTTEKRVKVVLPTDSNRSEETHQFSKWVLNLGARVMFLQKEAHQMNLEELQREANTCQAFLQRLYEHATLYRFDLAPYYSPFMDIQERLLDLNKTVEAREVPWWKGVFRTLWTVFRGLASFMGFALPALESFNNLFLLPPPTGS
jgi:hypothetical protein